MPLQLDPKSTRGTRQLSTIQIATSTTGPASGRFGTPSLAVHWLASFLTADSSAAFTVQLFRNAIDANYLFDTENIPSAGFNSANFPDFLIFPGDTIIAQIPATVAGGITAILSLWGHIIPL